MATINKRTTVTNVGLIGILLIAAWLLVSDNQAVAETTKFMIVSYIMEIEQFQVGDMEGHFIGIVSRRGLAFFDSGEIATYQSWETYDSDISKFKAPYQGYYQLTYEDGSTTMSRLEGTLTSQHLPWWWSWGRMWAKGTGEYIKGTGRFEGIRGSVSFTGRGFTPSFKEDENINDRSKKYGNTDDFFLDVTATYTLPSR